MSDSKPSPDKQALREIIVRAIDTAWDHTPVERDHCCEFFARAVIAALAEAGYAIVPVEPVVAMADPRRQKARNAAIAAGIPEGMPCPDQIMLAAGYSHAEIAGMREAASRAFHGRGPR